ncbi:IclR family transcriptional regulator [Sphingomonas xinjiangensis]|uniref:DNA-binding IclR family transcriptional regulator n=1 Tax=Sphingomonas xinjiangensis TaxID=643568 RepID=A0A840YPJ3_9SPHN|nr:IclR family transcriptional regulator [Sphingomonas xinjiangensis]MBB5712270.1 DNA-binding IclR family transcriptional regulator [Sphingomonas xinjiangensis]
MNKGEVEVDPKYRAPALEKGLDILELLATEPRPMTLTRIVNSLGRSHGELFRMVQVLEHRGYIEPDPSNEGYRLTDRLFSLGMQQPRTRNLIELALPVMRELAASAGQSCHLALHTRGEMVVVARMESGEQLGFSVRVGYRRPLMQAASGAVLYAFQPADVRRRWEAQLDPQPSQEELAAFRAHAESVRERHVELTPSQSVAGVTDISAPVMRGGIAAAALTVPYLKKLEPSPSVKDTAVLVREAADRISDQLVEGDGRV